MIIMKNVQTLKKLGEGIEEIKEMNIDKKNECW